MVCCLAGVQVAPETATSENGSSPGNHQGNGLQENLISRTSSSHTHEVSGHFSQSTEIPCIFAAQWSEYNSKIAINRGNSYLKRSPDERQK